MAASVPSTNFGSANSASSVVGSSGVLAASALSAGAGVAGAAANTGTSTAGATGAGAPRNSGAGSGMGGVSPRFVMPKISAATPAVAVAMGHHGVLGRMPNTSAAAAATRATSTLR